jgi:hypothetical protein
VVTVIRSLAGYQNAPFHDREGLTTFPDIKPFVIMAALSKCETGAFFRGLWDYLMRGNAALS